MAKSAFRLSPYFSRSRSGHCETLEVRRLLDGAPWPVGPESPGEENPESNPPATVVSGTEASIRLNLPSTIVVANHRPPTLRASVKSADPSVAPSGVRVRFLDLAVEDYASTLFLNERYKIPAGAAFLSDPKADKDPVPAQVLGDATTNDKGLAKLPLQFLMPGHRRIVAIVLGHDPPATTNRATGHDAEVNLAWDNYKNWFPCGGGVGVGTFYLGSFSAPDSDSPFLGATSATADVFCAMATKLQVRGSTPGGTYHTGIQRAFPFTNPPALGFSLTTLDDVLLGDREQNSFPADLPFRGSFNSATAGITVNVPLPPASGGSDGTGSTIHFGNYGPPCDPPPPPPPPIPVARPVPTGRVRIYDGYVLIANVKIQSKGEGAFLPEVGSLALGTHTLRFQYSGDGLFSPSKATLSIRITHTPTTVQIEPSANFVAQGQSLGLTATVSTAGADTVTPTGLVSFLIDGQLVRKVALGAETEISVILNKGEHKIEALYEGDENCRSSNGVLYFDVGPPA